MTVFSHVRRWLEGPPSRSRAVVPFAVSCPAGHVVRGERQRRHRVLRCPECGARVFILAYSPLPDLDTEHPNDFRRQLRSPWRRPLIAATATLLLVAAALAALIFALTEPSGESANVGDYVEAGERALDDGKLRRAAEAFTTARQLATRRPDALSPAELRKLQRLQRETSLLADLLLESLGEILLRAARSQEDEWLAEFRKRYREPGQANAVVFDAEVRREASGQFQLGWHLQAGDEPARIELGDLTILHGLPLEEPRRLLFGARLASIAREQNGLWVVRFEPGSGVLLTEPRAVAACWPDPLDEELKELLKRQEQWAAGK